MYHSYAISHEKFVWDARLEPGVLGAFSKIWGTDELLVSFDGINSVSYTTLPSFQANRPAVTLPLPKSKRPKGGRWPHQDQSSLIRGFQCAQGIVNLAPNGPDDGGLVVLSKSHLLNDELYAYPSASHLNTMTD
jgi:hypothetical protein